MLIRHRHPVIDYISSIRVDLAQATVTDAAWAVRRRAAAALLGSSKRLYWRGQSTMLPAPL